jgi:SAM-dependent methyltransferase
MSAVPDLGGPTPGARVYASTTERLDVDGHHDSAGSYLIYLFHIAAYDFAVERLRDHTPAPRVLDYGCGTGYGAHRLAEAGFEVLGVDVSEAAVSHAVESHPDSTARFRAILPVEQAPLPIDDASFDAVVSFQVIEHVPSVDAYLAEVARVLRPGGLFLCATPDRVTGLFPRQRPWNRWHLEEFDQKGLAARVGRHLRVDDVMGLTAPEGVVDLELRRARLLKWSSLPFTFPGAPERWRVAGIEAMRSAAGLAARLRRRLRRTSAVIESGDGRPDAFPFGPDDIEISTGAAPSTNVVLVASRPHSPDGR